MIRRAKSGTYTLQFDWAARIWVGVTPDTSKFNVFVNGKKVLSICPTDFLIHRANFQFAYTAPCASANLELMFCGAGASDSFGATIDNVSLTVL